MAAAPSPSAQVPVPAAVAWLRAPLLVVAVGVGVAGIAGGLARLGWGVSPALAGHAGLHGPLLLAGLFAAVIGLERAVALGRPWGWSAPVLAVASAAAMLAGAPAAAAALSVAAFAGLTAATVALWRRQPQPFVAVLVAAAACGGTGSVAWGLAGGPQAGLAGWTAFLVLTIAGERLELSRLRPPSAVAARAFAALVLVLLAAVAGASLAAVAAARSAPHAADVQAAVMRGHGLALLGLAAWLAHVDIARRTVRSAGLTRYMAVALLAGYGWLAVAGLLMALGAAEPGAPLRDAALHALLLGFVFSMVFAHAPVILPSVLRLRLPHRRRAWVPLALLHAAVAARLVAGLADAPEARRWAGALSALALASFVVAVVSAVRRRHGRAATPGAPSAPIAAPTPSTTVR